MADLTLGFGGKFFDAGAHVFNVKHPAFGAVGNITTDDTAAIQAAIDAAEANGGGIVFFPAGGYQISGITVAANNVRLSFDNGARLLYSGTGGVAVDFNNGSGVLRRCGFENLRVQRYNGSNGAVAEGSGSWSDGAVGVRLMACVWMEGRELDVEGFEYGFQLNGAYDGACAYNNFYLKRLFDNRVNLHLLVAGDGSEYNGYCNENKFSGGNLSASSARSDFTNSFNLRIEHDAHAALNNNVFWGLSFEGNATTKAFYIDGLYNALMWCRYEGTVTGEFGSNSDRNVVFYGRGFRADLVTNNGTRNSMFSSWGSLLSAGTLADEGAFRFRNTASFTYPAVSILGSGGAEVIRLTGEGQVQASVFRDIATDRRLTWGVGSPEGSVSGISGSLHGSTIHETLFVKTGSGTSGWRKAVTMTTNRETLAANKTLVSTDRRTQNLDPGGTSRDVNLPAAGANLEFIIGNRADAGGEDLVVKTSGGTTLLTLAQDEVGICICDGTGWVAYKAAGAVT